MADPMTLALVGAGAGAIMSPKDPLRGAVIGAIGGYAGGSALGASAAPAGGVAGGTGLTAASAGGSGIGTSLASGSTMPGLGLNAVASSAPLSTAPFASAAVPTASSVGGVAGSTGAYLTPTMFDRGVAADLAKAKQAEAMKTLQNVKNFGGLLNQGGQPTSASPAQMRRPGGGQVNMAAPIAGLLGNYGPMDVERRRRMSLLG